jgi:hypothetical protein
MGNSRREPLGSAEHTTFVPYANVAVAGLDKRFPIRGARAEASANYGTQDHPSPVHFRKLPPMKTSRFFDNPCNKGLHGFWQGSPILCSSPS